MHKADARAAAEDAHCADQWPYELVARVAVGVQLVGLTLRLLDADAQQHLRVCVWGGVTHGVYHVYHGRQQMRQTQLEVPVVPGTRGMFVNIGMKESQHFEI